MSTPVDREMPEDPPDAIQSALHHDGLGIEDVPALELLRQVNPAVAAIMSDRQFQNIMAYAYGDYAVTRNSGETDDVPNNSTDPAEHNTSTEIYDHQYDQATPLTNDSSDLSDEGVIITHESNPYNPAAHASAEQINQDLNCFMHHLPAMLGPVERATEPLSPRSTNVKVSQKTGTKQEVADVATAKLAAAKKAQKDKDHASPPPSLVYQPEGPLGEPAEKYRTGRLLGKGGFAICYEGELRGKRYGSRVYKFALKIVKAEMTQKKMQEKFRTELQIHSKMRHPNIVEFHRAFTFQASTYVVLELCANGSVMDMVKKRKSLSLPEARRFTVQLCGAIKYMHARDVIHRDLKMGNLFLDHNMNLKIGDFGLAAILVSERDVKGFSRRQTMCGTPNYIAPEILEKAKLGHDHKVDIWAVGIILFAMLTGVPPFQSNTQEEIYRKVKKIDYVWPENASCPNFIPNEAKGLVSMLLRVDAAERPDPDHIMAHRFFSMEDRTDARKPLIPRRLSPECRQQKPTWLLPFVPNGDVMDPDSDRITLKDLCRECGVGQFKDEIGNNMTVLDVVGRDVEKSLYNEFVEEERRGLTPVVPLPAETVYISHPILDSWPSISAAQVDSAHDTNLESLCSRSANLQFLQVEHITLPEQASHPPQSAPLSHAAQLRAQASRQASQTVSRASSRNISINSDTLRPATNTETSASSVSSVQLGTGLLNNVPVRSTHQLWVGTARQTQTLPRRFGRITRSVTSGVNHDVSASASAASATAAPTRVPRSASARVLQKDRPRDAGWGKDDRKREKAAINTKARIAAAVREEMIVVAEVRRGPLPILPRNESKENTTPAVLIGPDEVAECLPSTKPEAIRSALQVFRDNLSASLNDPHAVTVRTTCEGRLPIDHNTLWNKDKPNRPDSLKERPVVIKWVDYTNKFGIGYILANGSVGCVFKGEDGNPPTCIIVHGGEDHLRKRKLMAYTERHQIVPSEGAPIEFFENIGEEGIKRVFVHPKRFKINVGAGGIAEKLGPGADLHDYEKRKKLVLWDKFAKYMTQTLGKSEEDPTKFLSVGERIYPEDLNKLKRNSARQFIKFYQRLGNVGIWGFGNGSFQFNFPDHTKLVISDDGIWLDFYHLPIEAAKMLKVGKTLPADALEGRSVLSFPVSKMLRGLDPDKGDFRELTEANELAAKLEFIRGVVDIWYENGGLGCMGEGAEKRMKWEGVTEEGKKQKMVWVTVGAYGGDGPYEQEVPEGYYSSDKGAKDV